MMKIYKGEELLSEELIRNCSQSEDRLKVLEKYPEYTHYILEDSMRIEKGYDEDYIRGISDLTKVRLLRCEENG